jgi:hypothetical protein
VFGPKKEEVALVDAENYIMRSVSVCIDSIFNSLSNERRNKWIVLRADIRSCDIKSNEDNFHLKIFINVFHDIIY